MLKAGKLITHHTLFLTVLESGTSNIKMLASAEGLLAKPQHSIGTIKREREKEEGGERKRDRNR